MKQANTVQFRSVEEIFNTYIPGHKTELEEEKENSNSEISKDLALRLLSKFGKNLRRLKSEKRFLPNSQKL